MRMSCNGCRVLRKGCSDNCSIRPCLQWIKSPESQANATVFLAKFYGRAGLVNLINAGPDNLRPAIFRSLLYEACGRIVNPIYGSVGLLWSGSWPLCQAAVEAVLKGAPIVPISSEVATANPGPLKPYDIRHVPHEDAGCPGDLHRVKATRNRFKKTASKAKVHLSSAEALAESAPCVNFRCQIEREVRQSPDSHNSSHSSSRSELHLDHHHADADTDSMQSNETVEASLLFPVKPLCRTSSSMMSGHGSSDEEEEEEGSFTLDLTLGFEPPRGDNSSPAHGLHESRAQASLSLDFPI